MRSDLMGGVLDDVSDNILEQRVRTAIGRVVSHPYRS
jgi:hypothetical protein